MNIFSVLKNGAIRSASTYKFLIVMWLTMLFTICIIAFPLKAELQSLFGFSMLLDTMKSGFDVEAFGDMGSAFNQILLGTIKGGLILALMGLLLYSFFAGGLFTRFSIGYNKFKIADYFKASARYFFPFLGTGLMVGIMIGFWTLLSVFLPFGIVQSMDKGLAFMISFMKLSGLLWFLGMPVLLLIADNARRWMTTTGTRKVFAALGEGFRSTFKGFLKSYLLIFIILVINALLSYLTLKYVSGSVPETGILIFLFFIALQALAVVKLWVKAWRYATVSEIAFLAK